MPHRLDNQVAIITGGTSGIGKATVELFAKEGARVVFMARGTEQTGRGRVPTAPGRFRINQASS